MAASSGGFRNEFSWSHSRYQTFKECLRKYYYNYYAYWGGWNADADPFVRRLYVLKNLKNRYLWAGSAVHDAVAEILELVRVGQVPPDAATVAERTVEKMREGFKQSRSGANVDSPKKMVGLSEHHYREQVPDQVWRDMAEMVRKSIHGFCASTFLTSARELSMDQWLSLEKLLTFIVDEAKVYVKMDFAYRTPQGGAVIVDWKTGSRKPQPEGLQLGCYALYATEAWEMTADQIQVIEVNIHIGAVGTAQITEQHLASAREQISAGIADMRSLLRDSENNVAHIDDFPAKPNQRLCGRCVYREVCPEYQAQSGL
jgi:CRISPR/Cas system-associated exonuclease Cas4 (RecB family)